MHHDAPLSLPPFDFQPTIIIEWFRLFDRSLTHDLSTYHPWAATEFPVRCGPPIASLSAIRACAIARTGESGIKYCGGVALKHPNNCGYYRVATIAMLWYCFGPRLRPCCLSQTSVLLASLTPAGSLLRALSVRGAFLTCRIGPRPPVMRLGPRMLPNRNRDTFICAPFVTHTNGTGPR